MPVGNPAGRVPFRNCHTALLPEFGFTVQKHDIYCQETQFLLLNDQDNMQVALHVGAHCTDDDRILKCLAKNRDTFGQLGISIPKPNRYRRQLRDLMHEVRSKPIGPDTRENLLNVITGQDRPDRLVLTNSQFFGTAKMAVSRNKLYYAAERRLSHFAQVFFQDEVEVFLSLRNPATFLPALFSESGEPDFGGFLENQAPQSFSWTELILRIREELPKLNLTIWCNEDTPLIWDQLIREIAGVDPAQPLIGNHDFLREIMSAEGMGRFETYLDSHPGLNDVQKRRVIAAFLDKFVLEEELEEELDLPGWSDVLVDVISEQYEEDVYQISRIPGVNFISP